MNQEEWGKEKKIWTRVMMHEGCNMNKTMKHKQNLKQNATKHKEKWYAKDDGTRYRPKHYIDTKTSYMC